MTQRYAIGAKVWYRGAFGLSDQVSAVIEGYDATGKNGRAVYDVILASGARHWGYADQVSACDERRGMTDIDRLLMMD
jgi:hypothetical protein